MQNFSSPFHNGATLGATAGILAHICWGFGVLYWPLFTDMNPFSVMAHRMLWTFFFLGGILIWTGQLSEVSTAFKNKRLFPVLIAAALLLAFNWTLYVWALVSGIVVETTLGYFITPLINVLMGRILLGERISGPQRFALIIAFCALLSAVFAYGAIPWVGFGLAVSFALYGYLQKTLRMGAAASLFLQSCILLPACLIWLTFFEDGFGILGYGWVRPAKLLGTIFFTGIPLLLFGLAARRVSLAAIGILQYLSPSISFILAVTVMEQTIMPSDYLLFPAVWLALAICTWDSLRQFHLLKHA